MRTLSLVLGSIVVYFFVACASAVSTDWAAQPAFDASAVHESGGPESSTPAAITESGAGPKESGGMSAVVDAIADAVTDPVSKAAADPNMSGTKLKTQRYIGADGSSSFLGMYDSQRNVACSFQKAPTETCVASLDTRAPATPCTLLMLPARSSSPSSSRDAWRHNTHSGRTRRQRA